MLKLDDFFLEVAENPSKINTKSIVGRKRNCVEKYIQTEKARAYRTYSLKHVCLEEIGQKK